VTLTELQNAVDDYLTDPLGGLTADTYGHPIGNWCVTNVDEFENLFSADRNPLAASFVSTSKQLAIPSIIFTLIHTLTRPAERRH
jgi:hypothetical protein